MSLVYYSHSDFAQRVKWKFQGVGIMIRGDYVSVLMVFRYAQGWIRGDYVSVLRFFAMHKVGVVKVVPLRLSVLILSCSF